MEYRPLNPYRNEIRLLTVLPKPPQLAELAFPGLPCPIVCTLDHFPLDEVLLRYRIWWWCRDAIDNFFPRRVASLLFPGIHDGLAFYTQHFALIWVVVHLFSYAFRTFLSLDFIALGFLPAILCLLRIAYQKHPDFFLCYNTFQQAWLAIRLDITAITVFVCIHVVLVSLVLATAQMTKFIYAFLLAFLLGLIRKSTWATEIHRPNFCDNTVLRYSWGDYAALSYTWGNPSSKTPIIIDGKVVQVTENLAAALNQFRDNIMATRGLKIWVDAVCINQNDIQERNLQVKRMLGIYQMAWTVYVWLGDPGENSALAIQWINSISILYRGAYGTEARARVAKLVYPTIGSDIFVALGCFLARPYWSRMWIIQELSVARYGSPLYCGEVSITWETLTDMLEFVYYDWDRMLAGLHKSGHPRFQDASKTWNLIIRLRNMVDLIKKSKVEGSNMDLGRLIALCGMAEATDDRDRIYGFLGLLEPAISEEITPNYELSLQHVYTDFTRGVIEFTKDLSIIHSGNRSTMQTCNPTWVGDFRRDGGRVRPSFDDPFNACLGLPAQISFSNCVSLTSCDSILTCKGFSIDSIDGVSGDPMEWFKEAPSSSSIRQSTTEFHAYFNDEGLAVALSRTLIGHRLPDKLVLPESVLEIPWFAGSRPNVPYPDILRETKIGKILTSEWYQDFECFRHVNASFNLFGRQFKDFFPPAFDLYRNYDILPFQMMFAAQGVYGKKLVTTKNGHVGLGVGAIEPGDKIFILLGSKSPIALRPSPEGYKVVGEMYLHGVMNGEAMKWLERGKFVLEDVAIC